MLCTGDKFGNNRSKLKELLERIIIGNFKSIMYLSLHIYVCSCSTIIKHAPICVMMHICS